MVHGFRRVLVYFADASRPSMEPSPQAWYLRPLYYQTFAGLWCYFAPIRAFPASRKRNRTLRDFPFQHGHVVSIYHVYRVEVTILDAPRPKQASPRATRHEGPSRTRIDTLASPKYCIYGAEENRLTGAESQDRRVGIRFFLYA